MENKINKNLISKSLEDVMHESMMPYSEYVILDRALPRVEDGLKPVQRRILYTMHELGIRPDTPYRKCARIVGDCLGKFHPHGDSSVYGALVRMAQPFNLRSCLVDGQGNFGSVDGDGAAAMRYTEARLTRLATEMLRDIEKDTVSWSCNFDDTLREPDMLPGRYPNLLVNGSTGIAVGLATNIPPHNLGETIDGVCAFIDNPKISLADMMKIIKGPDFPTGGYVISGDELYKAYEMGKGKIVMRGKLHIEVADYDKKLIVIDELPYQVNKSTLLENILKAKEDKKGALSYISDITDESDRNGMRAVIKVKKDGNTDEIIKMLFKYTNLSTSFGINMVAIANGKPQLMGLLDIISYYVDYQHTVIVNRSRYELDMAKKRAHILEGLVIAVQNIDEVIKIIKSSQTTSEAKERLRKRFNLSEVQAQAILDLRLARLTHLEIYKLENELKELLERIDYLTKLIASKKMQKELIKTELTQIKRTYKEARRSVVLKNEAGYSIEDESVAKPIENSMIIITGANTLKRVGQKHFNMASKEFSERTTSYEIAGQIIKACTAEIIYCFTNVGNCYKIDVDAIPDMKWKDKGVTLKSLCGCDESEIPVKIFAVKDDLPKATLLFYTKQGMVKRTEWKEYNIVKSTFQAIKLKDGDEVIAIEEQIKNASLMFVTTSGMCLNADMYDIPLQGRISGGVRGVQMTDDDYCVMIQQVTNEGEVLIVTDVGFAKRVSCADIDVLARYRKGVKIIDMAKSIKFGGNVVMYAKYIVEPKNIVVEAEDGYMISLSTNAVNVENRTQAGKQLYRGKMQLVRGYIYNNAITK